MGDQVKGNPAKWPLIVAGVFALIAVVRGFLLDARPEVTQPELFWSFLTLGLAGALLGAGLGLRHERKNWRLVLGTVGALIAWRVSYFPLMVVSGWKASIVEWLTFNTIGVTFIYPTFLLLLFAQNFVIGAIAGAAVAVPPEAPEFQGRLGRLRKLIYAPPRKALWALATVALPIAFLTSFSDAEDYVLFADSPWRESRELPPIGAIERNAYVEILNEHAGEMGPGSLVLAGNAAVTYPLVPESPWGAAMKGTLEQESRANPMASSTDRLNEHYLAYMAAHQRIRGKQ